MGLISKIEDKLTHSNKHEAEAEAKKAQQLEQKAEKYEQKHDYKKAEKAEQKAEKYEQKHEHNGFNSSSPNTQTGTTGYNDRESSLRHPVQNTTGTSTGQTSSGSHGHPSLRDEVPGHRGAQQPYSPYSSSGQQTAAGAAASRMDPRSDRDRYGTGLTGNNDGSRYPQGGMATDLKSGPHSHLENRDAIPTAGGEKLGENVNDPSYGRGTGSGQGYGQSTGGYGNEPYNQTSGHKQHHYGRDAALAGGAGTAAYGAHEYEKDRTDRGHGMGQGYGQSAGSMGQGHGQSAGSHANGLMTGSSGHNQHNYGRDAALVGGAGTAAYGAHEYESDRKDGKHHHGHHGGANANEPYGSSTTTGNNHGHHGHHNETGLAQPYGTSTTGGNPTSGSTTGGSGAYDAGYQHALAEKERGFQDAMRKIEAETRGQR